MLNTLKSLLTTTTASKIPCTTVLLQKSFSTRSNFLSKSNALSSVNTWSTNPFSRGNFPRNHVPSQSNFLSPLNNPQNIRTIALSCALNEWQPKVGPKRWPRQNKRMFPPQEIGEERRPAFICHMNLNFKYSPDNLWYVACLVRGMTIDEALRQLDYIKRKGAWIVKKTLLEAQELAVKEHNVEFRSNLWVAESFVGKGLVVHGIRRHARKRVGHIQYKYSHYFVRLEEGPPQPMYPHQLPRDGPTLLQQWVEERRNERIYNTF